MPLVRNIVALFVMLFMSMTLSAQEYTEGVDSLRRSVPDSLRRTYRHSDAVQLLTIKRDTLAAIEIWEDILSEDRDYAPANYYLSMTHLPINDSSAEYARRAYVADSTNKWYVQNYGTQLITIGNYNEALPVYRRLLALDKYNISAYYGLAYLYNYSRMPYSAITVLDSADMRLGRNQHISAFKQRLLLETKQYDKAIAEGRRIITEYPYDIEARLSLAETYSVAGLDSLELVTLQEAFLVDSTNVDVIDCLSSYYASKGDVEHRLDYDLMLMRSENLLVRDKLHRLHSYTYDLDFYADNYFRVGALVQALAIMHPDDRAVVNSYASHLLLSGDREQALDYLRRHLSDSTAGVDDYIYVMQLEHYIDRSDLLFEDLSTAMELYPANFDLYSFAGYVYGDYGYYKDAIYIFKLLLDIATNDEQRSSLWGYIGDIYHEQGKDSKAFKSYDKALRYNGDNVLVLNNYAYFLSLLDKDLEKALTMSARAIYLEANNSSFLDTHAWVLHRLGRNDEAKTVMRQALSLSSQPDANLLLHFGDILWALGEKFLAETYWEKAVDSGYDAAEMERHQAELKK